MQILGSIQILGLQPVVYWVGPSIDFGSMTSALPTSSELEFVGIGAKILEIVLPR